MRQHTLSLQSLQVSDLCLALYRETLSASFYLDPVRLETRADSPIGRPRNCEGPCGGQSEGLNEEITRVWELKSLKSLTSYLTE